MIGIYRITNNITNQSYIGKSIDIKRRFSEHKTPKCRGNKKLHDDIKRYGVNNFTFEIVEECLIEELNPKELFYIRNELPFYNTVGKPVSKETRSKISISTKKWWNNLSEDQKKKIIINNLTGPKNGHKLSDETKRKISKTVSRIQKQKIKIIETGQVFESVGDLEKYLGACTGTVASYFKGKIKTVKGFHVEKCRD